MEKILEGCAYVLGNNIDTDQIIPAEHLVYSLSDPEEKKKYGEFALSGVPITQAGLPEGQKPFVNEGEHTSEFSIIIGGSNFGCGSSREHAPFSLNVAGVKAIVAESYARIFYRNSVDGGFLVPYETAEKLNDKIKTGDKLTINVMENTLTNVTTGETYALTPLGDVFDIVKAGGIFKYARKNELIA